MARLTNDERRVRFEARLAIESADGCWIWQGAATRDGYGRIGWMFGDVAGEVSTHRLAFYLANGRWPAPGMDTMHRCDRKLCCNPDHLEEGTRSQNMKDAHARGLYTRPVGFQGQAHPRAKLCDQDVYDIRAERRAGVSLEDLAARYGVKRDTIWSVASGKSWSHLPFQEPRRVPAPREVEGV